MAEASRSFDDDLVGLFDLSHDAFCIAGFDGYLKRANPAFARSLGYTLDELLARPFMDNVHPDDVEAVEALLAELATGRDSVGFECREVCADGSVRWFEWSTSSRPKDGVVYGVARDVTDRRMANAELGALRRVATLAAQGVAPAELFAIVAEEVARVVNVPRVSVARYELDAIATDCASFPPDAPVTSVGNRWSLEGTNVLKLVRTSGESARIDDYAQLDGELAEAVRRVGIRSTVGVPIMVAGRLWGAMMVSTREPDPLPNGTEAQLASFTELLATAIANAESRDTLGRLADEQTALRRVATLVARGTPPSEVFAAVANEMARCLHAANVTVSSFDDETVTIVAVAALAPGIQHAPLVGIRRTLADGDNIAARVSQTGRPARVEGLEFQNAPGLVAAWLRKTGLRSTVAVPIIVDGGVWGMAALGSLRPEPMPPDTEASMSDFADFVGTAITNAATRAELIASRARIVAAADEGRRRLERDLHDGAQQRLVALGVQTRLAEAAVPPEMQALKEQLSDLVSGLTGVSSDLQEISRGIHPAILSKGGLGPALKALARRSTVPVELVLGIDQRLPDSAEVAAYYVVAETLTNVAKHAKASVANVSVDTEGASLHLSIRDDGIGGADTTKGSGLVGLFDRVEALGGTMAIASHIGAGTSLQVSIPFDTK
ncbi:GAF domain-containing protein [Mycobacterium sp.]|jgi:PAS domain S-box-containing protein|uniref:GAF domain-containing protein n=1 Tax=Mycobacterium sp. TaxID=1785 RepID=UPI0033400EE4|nr:domain S-box [Mycobacterium sp.]